MRWATIIVLSGWLLSILACVIVLIAALYALIVHGTVPDQLFGWANLVLGFLLSKVFDMANNYVDGAQANSSSKE
jgi:formate/nitrite transporter FocA (FNT family)